MPSAIAPEETSTISRPARFKPAISSAQRATAAWSSPRPSSVTRLEPTLTTMRLAEATGVLMRERSDSGPASIAFHDAAAVAGVSGCASSQSWIAKTTSRQPSPLTAAIANTGPFQRYAFTNALTRASRSSAGTRSSLFSTSQRGFVVERRVVALELVDDRARVADRIGVRIERREVDDVQQEARALQVAQEPVAEARAVGGALDQAGNVGDDEAAVRVGAHDAEVGRERRERIVGDLRPRRRHRADERALAGVGHAEQADVGQHLELELQAPPLARRRPA